MRDGFEHGVAAMQCAFRSVAFDRGSHDPGSRSERVGFGAAPVALVLRVLEADESPPAFVDEDRHGEDRERAREGERLTLLVGQVADVAADDLAAAEYLRPAREVGGWMEVRQPRIVDGRVVSAGFPAGESARVRRRVLRADVLEDVGARDARCLAQNMHQLDDSFIEASLDEKALGGSAHGLEDRVAAAQVALGQESLLARARRREDDRQLAGDVDVSYVEQRDEGGFWIRYTTDSGRPEFSNEVEWSADYFERIERGPIIIEDISKEAWLDPVRDQLIERNVASSVDIPLFRNGVLSGVLWFNS